MSGFEVAGVLLGVFPLIISGLEQWRNVAKVGGLWWRVRAEYEECLGEVKYHKFLFKLNLQKLLLPISNGKDEMDRLLNANDEKEWSSADLQQRLKERLQASYEVYIEYIRKMNETMEKLKKDLRIDQATIQSHLDPPQPKKQQRSPSPQKPTKSSKRTSTKSKWDYETFRLKFSLTEPERNELFNKLKEYNRRLNELLTTTDEISALQNATPMNAKRTSVLETVFKDVRKKSDLLFKALDKAWGCSCQQDHGVNLRLEHRTVPEIHFEVILISSRVNSPWSWKELQCGQMIDCSFPHQRMGPPTALQSPPCTSDHTRAPAQSPNSTKGKQIAVTTSVPVSSDTKLCERLGDNEGGKCMGIFDFYDETYHLHPLTKWKPPGDSGPPSLHDILSNDFQIHLTRCQRYSIALLLASSVAQLKSTSWLKTSLTKKDVLFYLYQNNDGNIPCQEPFIRRGFGHRPVTSNAEANDFNFSSLGILLLELCSGKRLEDHPLRQKYRAGNDVEKEVFDQMAAREWSKTVGEEGGFEYAVAVKWCFTGGYYVSRSWRDEIIKNVIRPLEKCQEYFKETAAFS